MKCPVCETQLSHANLEKCPQCDSDLMVFKLIQDQKSTKPENKSLEKSIEKSTEKSPLKFLYIATLLGFFSICIALAGMLGYTQIMLVDELRGEREFRKLSELQNREQHKALTDRLLEKTTELIEKKTEYQATLLNLSNTTKEQQVSIQDLTENLELLKKKRRFK